MLIIGRPIIRQCLIGASLDNTIDRWRIHRRRTSGTTDWWQEAWQSRQAASNMTLSESWTDQSHAPPVSAHNRHMIMMTNILTINNNNERFSNISDIILIKNTPSKVYINKTESTTTVKKNNKIIIVFFSYFSYAFFITFLDKKTLTKG